MPRQRRPEITYFYRGQIERASRSRRFSYRWVDGWSPAGTLGGIIYHWLTRHEAQQYEAKQGRRAIFVRRAQP